MFTLFNDYELVDFIPNHNEDVVVVTYRFAKRVFVMSTDSARDYWKHLVDNKGFYRF